MSELRDKPRRVKPITTTELIRDYNSLPIDMSDFEWVSVSAYDAIREHAERLAAALERCGQTMTWFWEGPYGPSPDPSDYEAFKEALAEYRKHFANKESS